MKLAAIDIGSNAIRLQITRILPQIDGGLSYKILENIRFPLRLGDDAFRVGEITFRNETKFIHLMLAFRTMLDLYEVDDVYGCATSALRDANNGDRILKRSYDKSGLHIDVISGEREAELLQLAVQKENEISDYIHVDVGGGSTEINLVKDKVSYARSSFELGSVRNMRNRHSPDEWDTMKNWLLENHKGLSDVAIATGGNIKTIAKIAGGKKTQALSLATLQKTIEEINGYSVVERIDQLLMREDRADVISYASEIYLNVIKWSGANQILTPDIGLKDGIIQMLYNRRK
ncbi:Exopolyphosphatase [hydrothermal vent metagenome]|uniref:Exopolyphosphatase n=1 Tax=hydrothermal vent metagenome TaxID=652676 RepID=A0A3B1DJW1_9ZZZZ